MHNYELIRKEIDVIDGGTFQTLAERCCFRKFGFKSANYFGTKTGSVKTTKGHPDSFYETNSGGWAFLEAGHVSDKSQAIHKIQDDIHECLGYEEQHPEMGTLDLIICCYSCSRFTPTEINSIRSIDSRIRLIGPDDIAEMCTDYPWFAHEYLGIETLPAQVCDLGAFASLIEQDAFAPSLEFELVGRDQEIEDLSLALTNNQAICLTGQSGSGKTKLAIEICARYSALQECDALVVRPSRKSIYEALARCCSGDKAYLVLLDDANDLADLKSIREYVSIHENVKIIATVRNYVKQPVIEELRHIRRFMEYSISPVTNKTVEDILKEQLGINNQNYIRQIVRVAHGNMRLAILAGETAKHDGFQGVTNIHDLLKACYGKKIKEFSANEKKAIAIASILGAHKMEDNSDLGILESTASISHHQYKMACKSLHHKELLDMIQNYAAVSFEEQNLRDYFIQYAIIEEQLFSLKDIFRLTRGLDLIVKILNTTLSVFYSPQTQDYLANQIREIWDASDNAGQIELIKRVGNLIPAESLALLAKEIHSIERNTERLDYVSIGLKRMTHYSFESCILECIAGLLDNTEYWQQAISLLFDLLEKENVYTEDYCYIFDSLLQPNRSFLNASIVRERYVFEKLSSLYESTGDVTYAILILRYARVILSDEIDGMDPGEGNQILFYKGTLQYSDELIALREICIKALFRLRKTVSFTGMADSVVFGYKGLSTEGDDSLAAETCELILKNYHPPKIPNTYSDLQKIWDFRRCNKDVLCEFEWIDTLFNESPTNRLFSYSRELRWRLTDSDEEIKAELEGIVSAATEQDWKSFLALLQGNQPDEICSDYHIPRMLIWAIGYYDGRNSQLQELLIDTLFSLGIGPSYDLISIFDSLESLYPFSDIRQILIAKAPRKLIAAWLSSYDSYFLAKTKNYSAFSSNTLNGLAEYGEVVHFADVVHTDIATPGFLGEYCSALIENPFIQPRSLNYYLAGIDKELSILLKESLSYGNNLKSAEELICFLLRNCDGYWHGKKLYTCVVEKDPEFIRKFLPLWIEMESRTNGSCDQDIGELYWELPNPIGGLPLLVEIQEKIPSNYSAEYDFKKCVKSIVKEGIKKGYREQMLDWLSSEAVKQLPFSEIAVDVGASLDYSTRTDFCIEVCAKGASVELFMNAATMMPFNVISWSGSELPLIDEKIDYANNLAQRLLENKFPEQSLNMQVYSRNLKKYKNDVEVREFIEPF